jgi:hypothetical protein
VSLITDRTAKQRFDRQAVRNWLETLLMACILSEIVILCTRMVQWVVYLWKLRLQVGIVLLLFSSMAAAHLLHFKYFTTNIRLDINRREDCKVFYRKIESMAN